MASPPLYHYHKAPDCLDEFVEQNKPFSHGGTQGKHGGLIGYALDGFGIYTFQDIGGTAPVLDECGGHFGPVDDDDLTTVVYHYHTTTYTPCVWQRSEGGSKVRVGARKRSEQRRALPLCCCFCLLLDWARCSWFYPLLTILPRAGTPSLARDPLWEAATRPRAEPTSAGRAAAPTCACSRAPPRRTS
jgi:hypothetical protein